MLSRFVPTRCGNSHSWASDKTSVACILYSITHGRAHIAASRCCFLRNDNPLGTKMAGTLRHPLGNWLHSGEVRKYSGNDIRRCKKRISTQGNNDLFKKVVMYVCTAWEWIHDCEVNGHFAAIHVIWWRVLDNI